MSSLLQRQHALMPIKLLNYLLIDRLYVVKTVMLSLFIIALSGCQSSSELDPNISQAAPVPVPALGNVEYHTYVLANELFAGIRPMRHIRYAVVGFVPVDTMKYNPQDQHPLMMLGHQLEQGMITEATKRGFIAQEFKLSNDIMVSDESDRVLTRNLDHLSDIEHVDYYITGTLVYQQSGAMVNARIINARNKDIVAAATRFFPADLFWEEERVTSRNGRLYRTEGMR